MSPAASSRWCPTPEQLMILEELYRSGIRTPNASQIQRITSHLSLYGKIEGKNVFYWFQNHKARDRQKLRRKLIKQLQLQQQQDHHQLLNYFDPHQATAASSIACFHQPSFHDCSSCFLPPPQGISGLDQAGAAERMNLMWKVHGEAETSENPMMRMNDHDWMMMMVNVGPQQNPSSSRPIKTLQLFPIKEEECNSNSSSSRSSSISSLV